MSNTIYTTEEVARIWTERAAAMGFHHIYNSGSVRKALSQGRIHVDSRIGTNNIFDRQVAERTSIRPWLKKSGNAQVTCPHCHSKVSQKDVLWRTWAWCTTCRSHDPDGWEAEAAIHFARERLARQQGEEVAK